MIYLFLFCKPRLQRTILLSVLVFYSLVLCAQSLDYERMNPHPRLLLTQGGEEAVKRSITCFPSLLKVHERILKESDENSFNKWRNELWKGSGCWVFPVWH